MWGSGGIKLKVALDSVWLEGGAGRVRGLIFLAAVGTCLEV